MNVVKREPILSVIIPAYNAAGQIEKALMSIAAGLDSAVDCGLEVIVVDDGSTKGEALALGCLPFPGVRQLRHNNNRGMCAARNTGICDSRGEFVTLLDADDEFIADWFSAFLSIIKEWPEQANVCFTPCINDAGERTCSRRDYKGWLTAEDMALENLSGEYNPIFRGAYIRRTGYTDLGTRKSCGLLTYLRMAREAPFWITDKVQRIYHDAVELSVTSSWTRPDKAAETYCCFSSVLKEHGSFIRGVSEKKYLQTYCKALIYRMLALQGRGFGEWWGVCSWRAKRYSLVTLALLLIGPRGSAYLLRAAKRFSVLRKYG